MRNLLLGLFLLMFGTACTTASYDRYRGRTQAPRTPSEEMRTSPVTDWTAYWRDKLNMQRTPQDLGFTERRFNPCDFGTQADGSCLSKYLTVIHFQLLCRDSQGTIQDIPKDMMPLMSSSVNWSIGGHSGNTATDAKGFGQVVMLSGASTSGKRLTLRIGKQYLGFTASDLTRVVLPRDFCS